MRNCFLIVFSIFASVSFSSAQQWQQRVSYKMDIDFDHTTHRYTGKQVLTYFNNSPDELTRVYYHLYFNAFQPGSAMDVRSRTIEDPDSRVGERIYNLLPEEIGYTHIKSISQNGKPLAFIENETILEVLLDKPIAAGNKAVFEMEFESQVPLQVRRSGRDNVEGIDYSMSQWYPKISEYDENGWSPNPYVGREFYGVWGDFEVNISIDKLYKVAATGFLMNGDEVGFGFEKEGTTVKTQPGSKNVWKWKAENVHDFVWAADRDYVHNSMKVPNGPLIHFFYQNDATYAQAWKDAQALTVKAFEYMSRRFGVYPYAQYSVIQGGDGGMEYPMATLVTGNRKLPSLVGVTVHEAAHSWYHGVLGFNESLYSWMDEGFTSFVTEEVMDHLFRAGMPSDHAGAYSGYFDLAKSGKEEPLTTHADHYHTNYAYGNAAYSKGEVYLCQLGYVLGENNLRAGLIEFYNLWKFKHPDANDLLHTMELQSGMVLDWYHEYFANSTHTIDYTIRQVMGTEDETNVYIERKGRMPMPVDLLVTYTDGSNEMFYIPLDLMRGEKPNENEGQSRTILKDWKWVEPYYLVKLGRPATAIASIEIDPSKRMADIARDNNKVEMTEGMIMMFNAE